MPDILITESGDIVDGLESGLDYLATLVVDNLLNTIATDLYSPNFGTDLKYLPRYNIGSKTEITMKFMMAIEHVQNKILEEQSLTPSTIEEMLSKIKILDIFEKDIGMQSRWVLRLRVFSQKGNFIDTDANLNKILNA